MNIVNMDIIIIVMAMVFLAVDIMAALRFKQIAAEKGYNGYFWWCFLFLPIGMLMVVALPDRGRKEPSGNERSNMAAASGSKFDDSLPEL